MNKRTKPRKADIILWLLVVIWCGVIFFFSAENGMESAKLSDGITAKLTALLFAHFDRIPEQYQILLVNDLHYVIRKTAHFCEYAVLGGLVCLAWRRQKLWFRFALSVSFSFLYACSDEFHQRFSDGRTPSLTDVGIDTAGAILGVLCAVLIYAIYRLLTKKPGSDSAAGFSEKESSETDMQSIPL